MTQWSIFYRLALYLPLGWNTVPLGIKVPWASQISPFSFSSPCARASSPLFSFFFQLHLCLSYCPFSLFISHARSLFCYITSLNSYGVLNYLHKLLLYRDLLNILPRTTGVPKFTASFPFPLLYTVFRYLCTHQREREFVFIINILCDV